jgi:hypothetical protein
MIFIGARARGGNNGDLQTAPAGEPAFSESPVFYSHKGVKSDGKENKKLVDRGLFTYG